MTENLNLYFAYGSNMDESRLSKRVGPVSGGEVARLDGYRFRIDNRGKATIDVATGAVTYGRLWRLTKAQDKALEDFEGFNATPKYYHKSKLVVDCGGTELSALVYIANGGARRPDKALESEYRDSITSGAKAAGLPAAYQTELAYQLGIADAGEGG